MAREVILPFRKMNTNLFSSEITSKIDEAQESDENESVTVALEAVNEESSSQDEVDQAIKSSAFVNSIFHPEYKLKMTLENEEKKAMNEYDKLVEKLSKGMIMG